MKQKPVISYTLTDEAPALATRSWLPIIQAFLGVADIAIETFNISLAGRILAQFPDFLKDSQKQPDALAQLAQLTRSRQANIIKLPNISASIPQLQAAIAELQQKGYALPDYPLNPNTDADEKIVSRYAKIAGSAVNPVLREGNSDRRAPRAVKEYAKRHPHYMGAWDKHSKTRVASMPKDDFYATEQSICVDKACQCKILFITDNDEKTLCLKENLALQQAEIIDAAVMHVDSLRDFVRDAMRQCQQDETLLSLHLKATMMKVSDPVIFGHVLSVFFEPLFEQYSDVFAKLDIKPELGLADLLKKLDNLDDIDRKKQIQQQIEQCLAQNPPLAMVDSDQGITNLHVPSDVIIDASMPAMIRNSGKMYNAEGALQDTLALIPDRSYAGVYQQTIDFCKEYGAFDPAKMGTVANVGLMAQKAEEYGSHDKTFIAPDKGEIQLVDDNNTVLLSQKVARGDICRLCQTKDAPVQNWIQLAIERARLSKQPAVFWLDPKRAHDRQLIHKVKTALAKEDIDDLDIRVLSPQQATQFTLERLRRGEDTISVTGNVLRDYLTDLFPILEVGTSAKMLSIVPLMQGGGLFETGAGGSAPKHVQQLLKENHLRWDSLGEFLALGASLEHLSQVFSHPQAKILAQTLDSATTELLMQQKSPQRQVGQPDNRGSHFYMALYWSKALAQQQQDRELQQRFTPIYQQLQDNEQKISAQLLAVQGQAVDPGGYYLMDAQIIDHIMRPSCLFNEIIAQIMT